MIWRAVVADDEPHALAHLVSLLEREPDFRVVARCPDGEAAVSAIVEHDPDLAFLDIRMPGLDGFQVLDALPADRRPRVIFVTAYDEHAMRAFESHAVAYLLKPFDQGRLAETLDHLRATLKEPPGTDGAGEEGLERLVRRMIARSAGSPRIVARSTTRTRLVDVASIDWIEASGNYVRLHCGSESHLVSRTIRDLAGELEPHGFARIHRSAIVNLDRVTEFRTEDHRDFTVLLTSGVELRMSRTYREEVESRLGDRI